MKENSIEIKNIGKQYRLGLVGTGSFSDDLKRWIYKLRGKEDPFLIVGEENDRTLSGNSNYVWALKNISFNVKKGEVLGIIGRNGAGKSTLLKLLSRVTGPTVGQINVKGRMASLLEVGTGFHPELTGKENIYLNGAILGMSKSEISNKIDEIIDFSGIRKYIDTPVKRYSSGMKVRLAFAVAAHLDPEILIVDEVLAVGDAEFQKKAVGKLKNVSSGEDRTVLFVSHNMVAIENLCTRLIVIDKGGVIYDGDVKGGITKYLQLNSNANVKSLGDNINLRPGNGKLRFTDVWLEESNGIKSNLFRAGDKFRINIKCKIKPERLDKIRIVIEVFGSNITPLFRLVNEDSFGLLDMNCNETCVICEIPKLPLKPGEYYLNLIAKGYGEDYDEVGMAAKFQVEGGDFYGTGKIDRYSGEVLLKQNWIYE